MIKFLSIRNFAVIERVDVEFLRGLNLLTGETGSGKSIIVDALGLLLGERSSLSQIRTGEDSAFVEGVFEISDERTEDVRTVIDDAGIDLANGNEIIIRREVASNGRSRVFVNDRSVTLAVLKKLQPFLVDIHGQGDQQLLVSGRAQMEMLDAFADCHKLRERTSHAFFEWKNARVALNDFLAELDERNRKFELMEYQLAEIEAVAPESLEDERLEQQRKLMVHAEKLIQLGSSAFGELYEQDQSVLGRLAFVSRQVEELSSIDDTLKPLVERLDEASASITDAADALRGYVDKIDFSPEDLTRTDDRLVALDRLKRKFGTDLNGILEMREQFSAKVGGHLTASEEQSRLEQSVADVTSAYVQVAGELSSQRKTAARKLAKQVMKELQHVALAQAQFMVEVETQESERNSASTSETTSSGDRFFSPFGTDEVNFLFSANPGETARPLSQVASGGELSRLMLALMTVGMNDRGRNLSAETLIFDEIDVGIGGGVAEAVGRRLKNLAKATQVLCVTHQPQIARFADVHLTVRKRVRSGRTLTSVDRLQKNESVEELARMIAGDQKALTAIETARWMKESSNGV
jgi:DNA repair protein RecN (Recombination protein N)